MCFTIEVHLTRKAIESRFSVDTSALYDFDFSYFYRAFSHPFIPVITQENPNHIQLMQWGLIPSWAGDRDKAMQIRKGTYNARAESLHEKPSFREPLRNGRCSVIAHGFFEWQLLNGVKVPWYIRLKNNAPFVFAGLYDRWNDPDSGEVCNTFSIITTRANPLMEKIHNTKKRMPVILDSNVESEWITGDISIHKANQLLLPFDEGKLHAHTVSHRISQANANPDEPDIIQPFDHPVTGSLF
ncbi:MAG: SOS response-associated peptidase [Bacteroidales bacterium]|nr:SOS response-associated peptidase [Bacteroidales bacterium]